MKKFFVAFAIVLFAVVACNKEVEIEQPIEKAKRHITVLTETPGTRTVLDDKHNALLWTAGDNFRLMTDTEDSEANHDAQTLTYSEGGKFVAEVSADATEAYAYYFAGTYTDANHSTPTGYTAYIESNQTQSKAGVLNGQMLPMAAKGTINSDNTVSLKFHQMAGVLALNIYSTAKKEGEVINSVKVIPTANTKFCGALYNTDLTSDNIVYTEGSSDKYTSVVVELGEAYDYASVKPKDKKMFDGQIYVVLAKQSYSSVKFEIETNKGKYTITSNGAPLDLAANDFYPVNINLASTSATFEPVADIEELSIADFIQKEVSDVFYRLTGTITDIVSTEYGNFTLVDETGSVYVYGLTKTKVSSNDKSFASIGVEEGDVVTLEGKRAVHNNNPQVGGAYYISHVATPTLSLDPSSLVFSASGGSETVTATFKNFAGDVTITASSDNNVFHTSVTDNIITVSVAAHTTDAEIGTLTVTAKSGEQVVSKTVDLRQESGLSYLDKTFFVESFGGSDSSLGTGSAEFKSDNEGWVVENAYLAGASSHSARFGTSSKLGKATTPSIVIKNGDYDYSGTALKLSFKAAAWDGNSEKTTLKVSAKGATLSGDGFTNGTVTTVKGAWTDYELNVAGFTGDSFSITFEGAATSNARFFLDEVNVYYGDTPKLNPGLGFENEEYTAIIGQTFTSPVLINPNNVSVTWSSSNTSVATVSNSGVVTIVGQTEGANANIKATFTGNDVYNAAEVSYRLVLVKKGEGGEVTFTAGVDVSDTKELTKDDVTITLSNGVLNREDNYRPYADSKMTISCTKGNITKIVFNCNANGEVKGGPGTLSTETGTYGFESDGPVGTWTGSSSSIVFAASKQCQINSFTVTYE